MGAAEARTGWTAGRRKGRLSQLSSLLWKREKADDTLTIIMTKSGKAGKASD